MQNRDLDTSVRELPSTTKDEESRVRQENRPPVVSFDPYVITHGDLGLRHGAD